MIKLAIYYKNNIDTIMNGWPSEHELISTPDNFTREKNLKPTKKTHQSYTFYHYFVCGRACRYKSVYKKKYIQPRCLITLYLCPSMCAFIIHSNKKSCSICYLVFDHFHNVCESDYLFFGPTPIFFVFCKKRVIFWTSQTCPKCYFIMSDKIFVRLFKVVRQNVYHCVRQKRW